jgi:S-adenosylmethionine-diacylglycerol 3-amino-3-carboxypropyl transferase
MKKNEYFYSLNYTLSNEDTNLEYQLIERQQLSILAIAGSGARVIPLLAKYPKKLDCIDLSFEQLLLTKLRIESLRQLSFEEFKALLGYHSILPDQRKSIFEKLNLDIQSKSYWTEYFEKINYGALIYQGKWEKAMIGISKIINVFLANKVNQFFKNGKHITGVRWNTLLFVIANSSFFNSVLYKGKHPVKNIKESYFLYYRKMFKNIFHLKHGQESFFIQLILKGNIFNLMGAPLEVNKIIFEKAKVGLNTCQINYIQSNIANLSATIDGYDFISLSDVASYFKDDLERNYQLHLANLLNKNGILVERYYFHIPVNLLSDKLVEVTRANEDLIKNESTQVYKIKIFQKIDL